MAAPTGGEKWNVPGEGGGGGSLPVSRQRDDVAVGVALLGAAVLGVFMVAGLAVSGLSWLPVGVALGGDAVAVVGEVVNLAVIGFTAPARTGAGLCGGADRVSAGRAWTSAWSARREWRCRRRGRSCPVVRRVPLRRR